MATALVGGALSLAFLAGSLAGFSWPTEKAEAPVVADWAAPIAQADKQRELAVGVPVGLIIPVIGVDALIEGVGVTGAGAMDTPKNPADAAWFTLGPRPGEIGSAVIAGHYGWKDDIKAVFDNLSELKPGDEIYIEDETGVQALFIVRELRVYDERDTPAGVFSSHDGVAHLNLITCGGVWDGTKKSYSTRVIVFADKK